MKARIIFTICALGWSVGCLMGQNNNPCSPSTQVGVHVVQKGETLYGIARAYKVSVNDLYKWNNMSAGTVLAQCATLFVKAPIKGRGKNEEIPAAYSHTNTPPAGTLPATTTTTGPVLPPTEANSVKTSKPVRVYTKQAGNRHVVQPGETLEGIARLYGYTTERFRSFNQINPSDVLSVGMQLKSTDCVCPEKIGNAAPIPPTQGKPNNEIARPNQYSNADSPAPQAQPASPFSQPEMPHNVERMQQQNDLWEKNQVAEVEEREKASAAQNAVPSGNSIGGGKNPASYMGKEELLMLDEINALRSNPAAYVPRIETYIAQLKQAGDWSPAIVTAYELIDELKLTPPLPALQPAECLYRTAKKHAEDQAKRGYIGHDSSDGSWPWDRIIRECPQLRDGNENLIGAIADPRQAVIHLLVDDGIETRGHRRSLLNGEWRYVSCYKAGTIGNVPNSWVQVFAY